MNTERSEWLVVFCGVSLAVHVVAAVCSPRLGRPRLAQMPREIEVTLEPMASEPLGKPEPRKPEVKKPEAKKPEPKKPEPKKPERKRVVVRVPKPDQKLRIPRPTPPVRIARPLPDEKPEPRPAATRDRVPVRIARNQPLPALPRPEAQETPRPTDRAAETPPDRVPAPRPVPEFQPRLPEPRTVLSPQNPLAAPTNDAPQAASRLAAMPQVNPRVARGGLPLPAPSPAAPAPAPRDADQPAPTAFRPAVADVISTRRPVPSLSATEANPLASLQPADRPELLRSASAQPQFSAPSRRLPAGPAAAPETAPSRQPGSDALPAARRLASAPATVSGPTRSAALDLSSVNPLAAAQPAAERVELARGTAGALPTFGAPRRPSPVAASAPAAAAPARTMARDDQPMARRLASAQLPTESANRRTELRFSAVNPLAGAAPVEQPRLAVTPGATRPAAPVFTPGARAALPRSASAPATPVAAPRRAADVPALGTARPAVQVEVETGRASRVSLGNVTANPLAGITASQEKPQIASSGAPAGPGLVVRTRDAAAPAPASRPTAAAPTREQPSVPRAPKPASTPELPSTRGSRLSLGSTQDSMPGTGIALNGVGTRPTADGPSRLGLRGVPFRDVNPLAGSGGGKTAPGGPVGTPRPGRTINVGGAGGTGKPGKGAESEGGVHVVYVVDVSMSMVWQGKLNRAKAALKTAMAELGPNDTFNIVDFAADVRQFAPAMVSPSPDNLEKAAAYLDKILVRSETNMSGALEKALALKPVTHVYLLSDGEPSAGVRKPDELRALVRRANVQHAQVLTLAIGLGEKFAGMQLLQDLAEDNDGQFTYVNLKK